ncbi:bifunctional 2-polyprenyl-6-hydroxyphenol methylase/3-demethylubiquinol 3-O-methyltransferase UbiG [Moraxella nonliquefaciens]|jgi:3-demethylubiquinone-9 3-O-methyltransferase|uniref:bifunctional 2-polyprenyl-6-hydroxyphenol methylase/3-demethylubiquinol 3-O-methyltransferase UbiG n=1 Tax=Moraxella nonliquefaciens TaxID=478 RepID=UPI001EF73C42|nr:bifunctional 2-polyprenyl-6-hydroxyphenol methylase/3-demethylubiquinol 3-O-methyltransferase UbiG [Moraxella nonliquefaciens]MCG7412489.1 bifunctional 2-polyprenyl-6-hydroxyphenol methylase/3-demethylubiquinol 3-O-methyltransferase UbiG [Moraxella nonliquefaciens]
MTVHTIHNADFDEIGKFTRLADEWWDKQGAFKSLHDINPLRLDWIEDQTCAFFGSKLNGKQVLDVGCGGGILSHAMAVRGADVLGVDLGVENLQAGQIHAKRTGMTDTLSFACVAIEALAKERAGRYDVVTCMEMLEHVPNPSAIVQACFALLKPNGVFVTSTINRNPKSYLFAIVGAEYILRLVDKGTHDFNKFITPAELDDMAIKAGFARDNMTGLHYNPITKRFWLSDNNVDVNYMMSFVKGQSVKGQSPKAV